MGKVIANGRELPAEVPCSLEQFLTSQGLSARAIVVELNGSALSPSEHGRTILQDGDKLEIVKVVAGG